MIYNINPLFTNLDNFHLCVHTRMDMYIDNCHLYWYSFPGNNEYRFHIRQYL